MPLDVAGISNIIDAIKPARVPKNLDRNELRRSIQAAWDFHQSYVDESGRRTRTKLHKQSAKIAGLAGKLSRLLENPENVKLIERLSFGFPICEGVPILGAEWETGPSGAPMYSPDDPLRRHREPSFDGLKAGLIKLKHEADGAARAQPGKSPMRKTLEVTPLMWLIGKDLADVYRLEFARKPGRARDTHGKPGGPFVRFVVAVLRELGKRVSVQTIDMAIRRVRALQRPSLRGWV